VCVCACVVHVVVVCAGSVTAALGDDDSACDRVDDDGTFNGRCVAEVRDGHLLIRWDSPSGCCWKLLLRHMNLVPSEHATYGFSLVRPGCKSPIVSVVVSTVISRGGTFYIFLPRHRTLCRLVVFFFKFLFLMHTPIIIASESYLPAVQLSSLESGYQMSIK